MKKTLAPFFRFAMPFLQGSLVKQILVGLILGIALAYAWPSAASSVGILGTIFVNALKGVAPVLVFVLVLSSIANNSAVQSEDMHVKPILGLYAVSTFASAVIAVVASFLWPVEITLAAAEEGLQAPGGIADVITGLVLNVVDNPFRALVNANYIGILTWAIALGLILRRARQGTREMLADAADAVGLVVRVVIRFAPVGIFGLVSQTFATEGFGILGEYVQLLAVLLGAMAFTALVLNPAFVWWCTHENPYPLTFMCLKESGISAFFTRSSAANIPVNIDLCRRANVPEATYSVTIPVGATANMAGAAITITVITLSAAHSLGIETGVGTAVFLSVVASICAAGTSGVPGGSLMLIPLACGLFGIDQTTAMQVVAVGFIISVLQDSCETGLNSSSDALFTIAATRRAERLKRERELRAKNM